MAVGGQVGGQAHGDGEATDGNRAAGLQVVRGGRVEGAGRGLAAGGHALQAAIAGIEGQAGADVELAGDGRAVADQGDGCLLYTSRCV